MHGMNKSYARMEMFDILTRKKVLKKMGKKLY